MERRVPPLILLLFGAAACAPSRPGMEAVWTMPGASAPFAYSGMGGDRVVEPGGQPRGDLPETAYLARDGMWRRDHRAAQAEARELGIGMLVVFWAEWCDECWKLDKDTFRDPRLIAAIEEDYVPLKIDVTEDTMETREVLEHYRVNRVPTVLIVGPGGRELARIERYVPPEQLRERLAQGSSPGRGQLAGKR